MGVFMKEMKIYFTIIFMLVSILSAQTSFTYFENFEVNDAAGWSFLAFDSEISIVNDDLLLSSNSDDLIHILPPIGATVGDFSFEIQSGSKNSGLEGGGFGRSSFSGMIAILISDYFNEGFVNVIYSNDIQSYAEPNVTILGSVPIPDELNKMKLEVLQSGNNLIVKGYVNDEIFYDGEITDADEGLLYGQMYLVVDPLDDDGLTEWSLDQIEINYNPFINSNNNFAEDFNNPKTPWFRYGDLDNVVQSISINDGKLNFIYNDVDETSLNVIPPIPSVTDFTIEVEGVGSGLHNAPFGISRFFDYKNYVTFFVEDNEVNLGYASNNYEPTVISSVPFNLTEIRKVKFTVGQEDADLNLNVWINDQFITSGTINNAPEKLLSGKLILGYDRGNIIDAFFENVEIYYNEFLASVPQTTLRYHETFDVNDENGWAFLAPDAEISTENGELKLVTSLDDYVHVFAPINATSGDFSIEAKVGSLANNLDGGMFGRAGFNSVIAFSIIGDTLAIIYTKEINSYDNPDFTLLGTTQVPDNMSTLKLEAFFLGNDILVKGFVNDNLFSIGTIYDADENMQFGKMFFGLDPIGDDNLTEWSLDEIDIRYNALIPENTSYLDEFTNSYTPWFRFGDFENIVQSVFIENGFLNFDYSGTEESSLLIIPPIGAVKDFALEVEGSAIGLHNAAFGISRFFDFKNYVTFFVEDNSIQLGYAVDSWEPTVINSAAFNASEIQKVKFMIEENSQNLTLTALINDQTQLVGTITNAPERIRTGHLAFGYDRGNVMDASINYSYLEYDNFITSVESNKPLKVDDFYLSQNYPNPFNPSTSIEYSIPSNEYVSLKVYDILGREIAVLVNQHMNAGNYSVNFNASNLSSGIYFYTLTSGNQNLTRKMLLLR